MPITSIDDRYVIVLSVRSPLPIDWKSILPEYVVVEDQVIHKIDKALPIFDPSASRRNFVSSVDEIFEEAIDRSLSEKVKTPAFIGVSD